jgi:AraC-like DNA-binding protein
VSYREHAPPSALRPWLECVWERRGEEGAPTRIVPDGCIDVVWSEGDGARVVGANTTAFLVALEPGVHVAGARMHPGAAPALLGLDAEAVRDVRVPVGDVLGDDGLRLEERLDGGPDRIRLLFDALTRRAAVAPAPDRLVQAAVARLDDPGASIAALADELGVSDRQLRRRVGSAVGYGPKRLARVLRLHRALERARCGDDLARVAYDAGYADQAHFAQDCRALAGVPPTRLLAT